MKTPVEKIQKTLQAINAFRARGGNYGTKRAMELIDRYNDQKAAVLGDSGWNAAWLAYCAALDAHPSHNGYDLFA
jgi:hypothetical protein